MEYLPILFRFIHILSAVALIGGVLSRLVENSSAAAWRPTVLTSITGLLVSGTYTYLHKTGLPAAWHPIFGVKILLALHVFAISYIATGEGNAKRTRQFRGVAISGVIVILLSSVLRYLSTK